MNSTRTLKKQKPNKQSKLDQAVRSFREIIEENLRTILQTKSGKYLILRLTYLLNKKNTRLSFCMAEPRKGITQEECKINVDLSHLLTSTDFYIIDESKYSAKREKESRPDVYIFHELVHSYHWLHNGEEYDELSVGEYPVNLVYKDIDIANQREVKSLKRGFPGELPKDPPENTQDKPKGIHYEEMRTIIGVPYTSGEFIVCENRYRLERKMPLRVNLLDAAKEGYNEEDNVVQSLIKRITPLLSSQY